jgi:hypothetical protein
MKTKLIRSLFILFFIITGVSVAQEYALKYKFGGGKTYKYSIETKSDITQEVMGQEMKIEVNSNMLQNMAAEISADNSIVIISSLDSAIVHTKMPMRDTTTILSNLIGKREKITISNNGKVIEKKMIDTISGQNEMYKQVTNGLDKFVLFPDKPVKIGESWTSAETDTIEMMGGKLINKADITYKLIGTENKLGYDCLKIEMDAKNNNEGSAKVMGMDLTIEGTGKTKGTIYFSQESGVIVFADMKVDNDMTMATTGEQNMIIPITQSTIAIQSLVK